MSIMVRESTVGLRPDGRPDLRLIQGGQEEDTLARVNARLTHYLGHRATLRAAYNVDIITDEGTSGHGAMALEITVEDEGGTLIGYSGQPNTVEPEHQPHMVEFHWPLLVDGDHRWFRDEKGEPDAEFLTDLGSVALSGPKGQLLVCQLPLPSEIGIREWTNNQLINYRIIERNQTAGLVV